MDYIEQQKWGCLEVNEKSAIFFRTLNKIVSYGGLIARLNEIAVSRQRKDVLSALDVDAVIDEYM